MSNPTSDFIADRLGDAVESYITVKLGIPDWSEDYPDAYLKMFDALCYADDYYLLEFINEHLYKGTMEVH